MASQRFCLRWNNHQSNLLSVFDQLLHAETFTDVTLAVEGQYLKAHKMVLSACSPYFQALFVNHPEKHPIVILKDVPFSDMKCLLDFMYRGEVSVDQERLTAFLRVAESLRIKGLTEVNDERPSSNNNNNNNSSTPPPPQLHRINPYFQRKSQGGMMLANPLLGSALTGPKRKRGRPRKLSGSSTGTGNDYDDDGPQGGSPEEMLECKLGGDSYENSDDNKESGEQDQDKDSNNDDPMDSSTANNKSKDTSKVTNQRKENDIGADDNDQIALKLEPYENNHDGSDDGIEFQEQKPSTRNNSSQRNSQESSYFQSMNNNVRSNSNSVSGTQKTPKVFLVASAAKHQDNNGTTADNSFVNYKSNSLSTSTTCAGNTSSATSTPNLSRPVQRRRVRRKANSNPDDPAEHLTEMSVRGLDLFRYASISEGVYQCTECAKENIQKTFKNKYSFQRHAFLYHEGIYRKVFPCPVCGKEFSRPDKMKNHLKTTHQECLMVPKDTIYPLNFLVGGGGEMPGNMPMQITIPTGDASQSIKNEATTSRDVKAEQFVVTN